MSALAARFDARWSAVFIKEVRAALRGKLFRLLFATTLGLAMVIAMLMLTRAVDPRVGIQGREFFQGIYVCLAIALFALVPFSAFTAMGAEWDEGTIELLVASDLRPRQIVLGKLGSAALEALLYTSAFTPFLAFAFLMRGVDALGIALILEGSLALSFAATAVALWLSCITKLRILRVLLLVVLAAAAVAMIVVVTNEIVEDVLRWSHSVSGAEFWIALNASCLGTASLALALACQRLAHEEENRSTPARIVISAGIVVFVVWMGVDALFGGRSSMRDPIEMFIFMLAVVHVFFATEAEPLPRRVRVEVPRSRFKALLAAPFLPGGGRAVILFVLQVALLFAGAHAVEMIRESVANQPLTGSWSGRGRAFVFALYFALYVVLGALVASRWTASARGRIAARIVIPLAVLASIVVPSFVALFVGADDWADLEHPLVPFEAESRHGTAEFAPWIMGVGVLLALAIAASLPRIVRGVREVLAASVARAARS